jgi:hypothetical protein
MFKINKTKSEIFFDDDFKEITFDIVEQLKKVKTVYFNQKFNQNIDDIPDNVEIICLGRYFNKPIYKLPKQITHIIFDDHYAPWLTAYADYGSKFNFPMDNIPHTLLSLKLPNSFNLPLDLLPSSLLHLSVGALFNHSLNNLPINLKSLMFDNNDIFDFSLNNLPQTLCLLSFNQSHKINIALNKLPPSLKILKIPCNFSNKLIIPENLQTLHVCKIHTSKKYIDDCSNQHPNVRILPFDCGK